MITLSFSTSHIGSKCKGFSDFFVTRGKIKRASVIKSVYLFIIIFFSKGIPTLDCHEISLIEAAQT